MDAFGLQRMLPVSTSRSFDYRSSRGNPQGVRRTQTSRPSSRSASRVARGDGAGQPQQAFTALVAHPASDGSDPYDRAMAGSTTAGGERIHLWLEHERVVAAAWIHDTGYDWCQSWQTPALADHALAAAVQWDVTPSSPPTGVEFMRALTWLRAILPLATRGERVDDLPLSDDDLTDGPALLIRRLVASGLEEPGQLIALSWPSLEVETFTGEPDPSTAAWVKQRLRDREREDVAAAERAAADRRRHEEESTGTEAESHAGAREAVIAEYERRVLTEQDFVAGMIDGACHWHLHDWADTLLQSVERAGRSGASRDFSSLLNLLRITVDMRRNQLDPFSGYLEAPRAIIALHQAHGAALDRLLTLRHETFLALLRDTARAVHMALGDPLAWDVLIRFGASPLRPDEPPDEWY